MTDERTKTAQKTPERPQLLEVLTLQIEGVRCVMRRANGVPADLSMVRRLLFSREIWFIDRARNEIPSVVYEREALLLDAETLQLLEWNKREIPVKIADVRLTSQPQSAEVIEIATATSRDETADTSAGVEQRM